MCLLGRGGVFVVCVCERDREIQREEGSEASAGMLSPAGRGGLPLVGSIKL